MDETYEAGWPVRPGLSSGASGVGGTRARCRIGRIQAGWRSKFPAAVQNIRTAIRFLREHAQKFKLDHARFGIFGELEGGQLAALVATTCGLSSLEPAETTASAPKKSGCVQAAASWYGIYDFVTWPSPAVGALKGPQSYLGCHPAGCSADTLRFASPVSYVAASNPPMLLIHGEADGITPSPQAREFEARLKQAGVSVEAIHFPQADHGLIDKNQEVSVENNNWATEAMQNFLDRLGPRQ